MNRIIKVRFWEPSYERMRYDWVSDNLKIDFNGVIISFGEEGNIPLQFIGISDKHGKEIFEGDIVKEVKQINGNWIDTLTEIYEVIYKNTSFQFYPIKGREYRQYTIAPHCDVEIIGNIYSNPELIQNKTL